MPETERTMKELFERAEREGLWFYTKYQQIWLSPKELRDYQAEGKFRWSAPNWKLRDPQEHLDEAANELDSVRRRYERIKAQVEAWKVERVET